METDILGRELKENDLVVAMATGKYSNGMRVGLWNGTSVTYKNNCKSKPYNVYLINNPDETELEIKEQILKDIKEDEEKALEEKLKRKAKKSLSKEEITPFNSYLDDKNEEWIYLGYGTISTWNTDTYSKEKYNTQTKKGYIYVKRMNDYDYVGRWSTVLKHPKKLVKKLDKSIEPFENYTVDNWNGRCHAEIELNK